MTIVLIGAPAAGKTRVGKRLAVLLDREFIDTDKVIVAEHGPISEIFSEHGETHFRGIERVEVERALRRRAVVSLGGGAVLDPETQRELVAASVVLLTTSADAVKERIANGKRPLITSLESWKELVAKRAPLYASLADYTVDTSDRSVDAVAEEIVRWIEEERGVEGES